MIIIIIRKTPEEDSRNVRVFTTCKESRAKNNNADVVITREHQTGDTCVYALCVYDTRRSRSCTDAKTLAARPRPKLTEII